MAVVPLAGLAMLAAIGVIAFKSPVRSALCLVLNFFMLAFLYFSLNAEILGITQVVVYAGAIMVLFLFVIMLLNSGGENILGEKRDLKFGGGILLGLVAFGLIAGQAFFPLLSIATPKADDHFGSPQAIGLNLFTTYAWPFEVASILLLVGIVGSILLAKRKL